MYIHTHILIYTYIRHVYINTCTNTIFTSLLMSSYPTHKNFLEQLDKMKSNGLQKRQPVVSKLSKYTLLRTQYLVMSLYLTHKNYLQQLDRLKSDGIQKFS